MVYTPDSKILEKYADVLVKFALNKGKGIKKGDVVYLEVPECAKPMLIALQKSVLKAGGHYITNFIPDETARHFYELAEEHHLDFFPEKLLKGRLEQIDYSIAILAETNKKELEGIDPQRIMRRNKSFKPYKEWKDQKESEGKFTWTLAMYGTEAMAREAGISLKEYWDQIIKACYLDKEDPVSEWKRANSEIERIIKVLNSLKIEKLHIESERVDLWVGLGKRRQWLGGRGCNIPSFEVFISPDCRMTEGKIEFDQPLYRYGNLIEGIKLEFKDGKVVNCSAKKSEKVLKEMIAVEGANMVGEFSLTDVRLSKISKFMAETLFDENFGGNFGNTHIALGSAYKDSLEGDQSKLSKKDWAELGFNESVVHTDIVSIRNRKVTAILPSGQEKLIYENGKFTI